MNHIETLNFELEALKQVLVSQNGTLAIHRRVYHHECAIGAGDKLQAKCSAATINEYETKHIPRTERHIAALEYILKRYEELSQTVVRHRL